MSLELPPMRVDPRPAGGLKGLLQQVADYYGVAPERLLWRDRQHSIAHPRQAFMWHARQVKWSDGLPRYSMPMIGAFLGLDHTTVLHGARQHEKRLRLSTDRPQTYQHPSPNYVDGQRCNGAGPIRTPVDSFS